MKKGVILNLQRMSTEDGPGIRTTVFFKGCTLKCRWCHNPESIDFAKEHEWFEMRCIRCGTCVNVCPEGAVSFQNDKLVIDKALCKSCLKCAEECPSNALEAKGSDWTVESLFDELIKDKAYFGQDGGVTLSGGEVLAQAEFAAELLKKSKAEGVHTAVDTCGYVKYENIKKVIKYADLFLFDLKLMDEAMHQKYTGASNKLILENFEKLSAEAKKKGAKIWIRTPLIPNVTDTDENIKAIAEFIEKTGADAVERWELLSFNNLCESKYQRMGKQWDFKGLKKQSSEKLDNIQSITLKYDSLKDKAFVTGR